MDTVKTPGTVVSEPGDQDPAAVRGVILDFNGTLFHWRDTAAWVRAVRGDHPSDGATVASADLARHLDRIWTYAAQFDPGSRRDLDRAVAPEVFAQAVAVLPGTTRALADALWAVIVDQWVPFDDTLPMLRALRAHGVRTVLLSNIGVDIHGVLRATGVAGLLDDVVLSYEAGLVKPDPAIFALALERLGVPAHQALMVGDDARDDTGGAPLGLRTLILPKTGGPRHSLDTVTRLVTGSLPAGRSTSRP